MNYSKKSLGQNFLVDKNIIKKIISLVKIEGKNIIEIGPGKGALTHEILKRKPKKLSIIEKDFNLAQKLKKDYFKIDYLHVYNADILKFDLEKLCKKDTIIFGNLPYNISSQILIKILRLKQWPPKISNLIFMFQKELGKKIIGKYSSSDYGRLSIITNYRLDIIEKFLVSKNCFTPKPKVTSMVINFKPKINEEYKINKINSLEKVTNILFSNKRKMINKNIKKILDDVNINKIIGAKLNLRPSEIKPEVYYKITEMFEKK